MDKILPLQQFLNRAQQHPEKVYLNQPKDRAWTQFSWAETEDLARRVASGLIDEGLQPGDRVAILAKNSAEWIIADLGIMMAGMVSVPVYSTAGAETIDHVLSHSDSKLLFIGKLDSYMAIGQCLGEMTSPPKTIGFPYPHIEADADWHSWTSNQAPLKSPHQATEKELMSIVYTSGSQGLPKGVCITHKHAAAQGHSFINSFKELQSDSRLMSYLPLAHITERAIVELASLYGKPEVFFTESLETFVEDLKHAQPTLFLSVPRLWSKFQTGVLANISDQKLQRLLKIPVIGKLVARKIRRQLGLGSCTVFASGSAPISSDMLKWYLNLGMPISEGWGMTETTGAGCMNHPFVEQHLGTIGKPLQGYQMKLSEQGEMMIRGDGVFDSLLPSP